MRKKKIGCFRLSGGLSRHRHLCESLRIESLSPKYKRVNAKVAVIAAPAVGDFGVFSLENSSGKLNARARKPSAHLLP
ncbi:MAG TPA: hypothetical protein VGB68_18940 [Pyrinomonadaceae bacterium]